MSKKWLSLLIAVVLLLSTVGTALAETAPGTCPRGETVRVGGKQGFHSSNSDFKCQTKAYNVKVSAAPAPKALKFVRPIMSLEKKTVQPDSVVFSGKTQVYFDLNKNQEKAWKAGKLAIYYYDKFTKTWTKLSSAQAVSVPRGFRIASGINNFGLYGLAMVR